MTRPGLPLPSLRRLLLAAAVAATLGACAHGPHDHAAMHAAHHGASQRGLSERSLAMLDATVRADVANGRIPGAVLLVERDGQVLFERAWGVQDPASGVPMTPDSIFRIYSMTKPIVSVAAMMLVEEGRIQLSDPVSRHLPELKDLRVGVEKPGPDGKPVLERVPARQAMTVQDLLRHTSGLTYGIFGDSLVKQEYRRANVDSNDLDNAELVRRLATVPLAFQPGSTWEYSRSTDVLGALIERVSGRTLDVFLRERILGPLGMKDTAFHVEPGSQSRIAEAFGTDPDSGQKVTLLDVRRPPAYLSGGGGMVSTARDYLRFTRMLHAGGTLEGTRLLSPKTVRYMLSDHLLPGMAQAGPAHLPGPGYGFGLGFAVRTETGVAETPGTVGDANWGGLGGTYFWIDPRERLTVIWMMQAPGQRLHYRRMLRNVVYGAF